MIGHITDGLGMLRAIQEGGLPTEHADVLIVGGGGAARVAAVEFLARNGKVTFAVRDSEKGRKLVAELANTQSDGAARIAFCPMSGDEHTHDLIVNCTPLGMYPHIDACPVEGSVLKRCNGVFDAVYNPRETMLLRNAKALGIPCIEGLGMLFYQAVEAERFWFGDAIANQAEQKDIYRALREKL